jgi:hypothetical protein
MAPSHPALLAHFLGRIAPFDSLPDAPLKSVNSLHAACALALTSESPWELTPEFFALPEAFARDFELPNGDPVAFVYEHRKTLESPHVSANLNLWIDLLFGCATHGKLAVRASNVFQPFLFGPVAGIDEAALEAMLRKSGQMPTQLFSPPHPQRHIISRLPRFHAIPPVALEFRLRFAHVTGASATWMSFVCVCEDDAALSIKVDLMNSSNRLVNSLGTVPRIWSLAGLADGFAAVSASLLQIVHEHGAKSESVHCEEIGFVAGSGKAVALCGRSGQIYFGKTNRENRPKLACTITNDYVCCLAVSSGFGIVAAGTRDGRVVVSLSTTGAFLFACDVGSEPKRIVITDGWGFIVVEAGKSLFLFSVNGRVIRKMDIEFRIQQMTAWTCERGMDFMAIADRAGNIRVFEVFFMKINEIVYRETRPIVAMAFNLGNRSLIIVTEGGEIVFIPRELT